ncbi:UNVERIFIED_CONTAM: hypothetical protein FKN15_049174 [Acipenser sinensis]
MRDKDVEDAVWKIPAVSLMHGRRANPAILLCAKKQESGTHCAPQRHTTEENKRGRASPVFQYPPVVRAEVGSTVHFTCDIGDLTGHCYSVLWLKIHPNTAPALAVYSNISPDGSHGSEADAPADPIEISRLNGTLSSKNHPKGMGQ